LLFKVGGASNVAAYNLVVERLFYFIIFYNL